MRLAAIATGLLAAGVAAAPASAAPVASTAILYGPAPVTASTAVLPGSLFSVEAKCVNDRKVKVFAHRDGARVLWGVGRSSREGAFAVAGSVSAASTAERASMVIPRKVAKGGTICAAVRVANINDLYPTLRAQASQLASRVKATRSKLRALGIDGWNDDGAVYGIVGSRKRQCVRGRTVKLFSVTESGDRRLLDRGRTGRQGGWAGHVTGGEDSVTKRYVAVLKRKKYRQRGKKKVCAGDRDVIGRIAVSRGGEARDW